jgi:hypothetical protein
MTLHYTLKKQWFDMTKAKIKREEYRQIKKYWVQRLCEDHQGMIGGDFMDAHTVTAYTFKPFTSAFMRNGYASDAPTHTEQIESITIGTGRPEWGAEPGKLYFVIKYKD